MTDKEIVEGKYYREEVNALLNAKSKTNALAIYLYITNPENIDFFDFLDYGNFDYEVIMSYQNNRKYCVKGNKNPKYLEYLKILNQIDEELVSFIEPIISNKFLLDNTILEQDLNILLSIKDKDILSDICRLFLNQHFLNSPYHIEDLRLISNTKDKNKRRLLINMAKIDIKNCENHEYDMNYLAALNLNTIPREYYNKIFYYLSHPEGRNDQNHIEKLEMLAKGIMVEENDVVLEYLDMLEKNPNTPITQENKINKPLSRIRSLFRKNKL